MRARDQDDSPKEEFLTGLMKDLYECAVANQGKKPRGWRIPEYLKELSTLFFLLGGKSNYVFMTANLPIPSLSTVKSHLHSTQIIKEGEFRILELKEYLLSRNEPLKVYLSEDATKNISKVQYHSETNQIVGPVLPLDGNGCPSVGSFPATSAAAINGYFTLEKSTCAYTIMAQPLGGSPPFCLALFGTDNRFTSLQVKKRTEWCQQALKEAGIQVIGSASDGDWRCMKVMRVKTLLPKPTSPWKWFQADLNVKHVYFQDFVHLLVKLKSRLLTPSIILPLGPKVLATSGHLAELIAVVQKDQHELTPSFLDNKDKMNFKAADKLSKKKVTDLLRSSVIESEGTATYLDMMREVFLALADPSLYPQQRIELLWEWVIFLRIWRAWILNHNDYTLGHNFISSNAYYCIEINAHALIQCIVMFRDAEEPHLFKPWLFNSQPCEEFYRYLRALTSTFSTVINFSILEMIYRLRRVDFITSASHKLKDRYKFPKNMRAFHPVKSDEFKCITLPENFEIEQYIQTAFHRALERALKLKILGAPLRTLPRTAVPLLTENDFDKAPRDEESLEEEEDDAELVNTGEEDSSDEEDDDDIADDVAEDIVISTGPHGVKTFQNVDLSPESLFVEVRNSDGGHSVIKKTTLCYLLSNGHNPLSNDRWLRVRFDKTAGSGTRRTRRVEVPHQEETVSAGSWCAFVSEERTVIIGRVLSFRYMTGSTWKNQVYPSRSAPTTATDSERRKLGCMCSWFKPIKQGRDLILKSVSMDIQGYYDLENYVCTIPRPAQDKNGTFKLGCTLQDIKKFSEGRLVQ